MRYVLACRANFRSFGGSWQLRALEADLNDLEVSADPRPAPTVQLVFAWKVQSPVPTIKAENWGRPLGGTDFLLANGHEACGRVALAH